MASRLALVILCSAILVQGAPQLKYKVIQSGQPKAVVSAVPKAPQLDEQVAAVPVKRTKGEEDQARIFKEQAESAQYSFNSSVDDGIMDHAHYRTETRNGLNVEGMYSYSDGFFKRTIHYAADDKGYRVLKEEVESIGDGPIVDLKNGEAVVRSSVGTDYRITVDDLVKRPYEDAE